MASICVNQSGGGSTFKASGQTLEQCTSFVILDVTEYHQWKADSTLSSADILYFYTWGFGAVLLPWSIAFAVKWAVKVIKQI